MCDAKAMLSEPTLSADFVLPPGLAHLFYQGLGQGTVNKPLTFLHSRKPERMGNVLGDMLGIPKLPNPLDGEQPEPHKVKGTGLNGEIWAGQGQGGKVAA